MNHTSMMATKKTSVTSHVGIYFSVYLINWHSDNKFINEKKKNHAGFEKQLIKLINLTKRNIIVIRLRYNM